MYKSLIQSLSVIQNSKKSYNKNDKVSIVPVFNLYIETCL